MQDQGTTTPGLKDPPFEEDARRLAELGMPRNVDEELAAALAMVRGTIVALRAAGDHLRRATAGLPETPLNGDQTRRHTALLHGIAGALSELDDALRLIGADEFPPPGVNG
jgi:hypothetical protein